MALTPLADEYDNMLRCIRCAACLTSCPTYVVSLKEEEGPRGRIAIMRALVEGELAITPDAVRHLDNCLLCEACSHVCPSGVKMEQMGVAFRATLRHAGNGKQSLGERFTYGWQFGNLSHFRLTARLVWLYQRSGLQWLARQSGVLALLGLRQMEALLPPIPDRFVVPRGQTMGVGEPADVFAGCIMSTAFAPTTEATSGLLAAFGCAARLPAAQVCCGALQLHAGETKRAQELARQNMVAFGESDAPVVVNAAGCGAMLKHYGQLLPDDVSAARFSARVRDVSEFLATRTPGKPARQVPLKVTVQDPCHLLHAQRIGEAPRKLLRAIPGMELSEMAEPGLCCGSGGIYNLSHPAFSTALQQRKCASILATSCDVVVTGNPGCQVQMQAGLPEHVRVLHLVDVLARAYLDPAPTG